MFLKRKAQKLLTHHVVMEQEALRSIEESWSSRCPMAKLTYSVVSCLALLPRRRTPISSGHGSSCTQKVKGAASHKGSDPASASVVSDEPATSILQLNSSSTPKREKQPKFRPRSTFTSKVVCPSILLPRSETCQSNA